MSDSEKERFEILERELEELYRKESRERKHWRYLHIGSILGIIFIIISTPFEREFYRFFGSLGMGIIQALTGLCLLMSFIYLLPGVRQEAKSKWENVQEKKKQLDKLRKNIK